MNWEIDLPGAFLDALSHHGGEGLHIIISTQPLAREKDVYKRQVLSVSAKHNAPSDLPGALRLCAMRDRFVSQ